VDGSSRPRRHYWMFRLEFKLEAVRLTRDRGVSYGRTSQYTSGQFQKLTADHGVTQRPR